MIRLTLLLIGVGAVIALLVWATKNRWISWRGGRGIATLTAFHDFQVKDKQHAIEIVMERKAGKKMEEEESGETRSPGEQPEG